MASTAHGAASGEVHATANLPLSWGTSAVRVTAWNEVDGGYLDSPGRGLDNTDRTRRHELVDWDGDGLMEIGSALPRALFDGHGRRAVTFHIDDGELPWHIAAADLTGHGMHDVLLVTRRGDIDKVYLYRSPALTTTPQAPPAGTGLNFTCY